MTAADRIRCFLAVDLEKPVVDRLCVVQAQLASAGADVRWVRPAGMHLTLKFLGSVEATQVERVQSALETVARQHSPLRLGTRGLGVFPSLRRPRVIWAGLQSDRLSVLATAVTSALTALGFAAEQRPFHAHVTLGRVNSMRAWAALEEQLVAHAEDDYGTSTVDAITLYRSTLHRDGAVYAPLWTISLCGNSKGDQ